MKYKSNYLNSLVEAYEDLKNSRIDKESKRKEFSKEYNTETTMKKLEKITENNNIAEDLYKRRVLNYYNKALKPIKEEYDKSFSGSALTDDIKLLNSGIELTEKEINYLIDRYKDNNLMLRAIQKYNEKNNINIVINLNDKIENKIQAVENAREYMNNYYGVGNEVAFAIVFDEYFPKLDKILSEG